MTGGYITTDRYGLVHVGPEGEGNVWHEQAQLEELGLRAWAAQELVRRAF